MTDCDCLSGGLVIRINPDFPSVLAFVKSVNDDPLPKKPSYYYLYFNNLTLEYRLSLESVLIIFYQLKC